jgi:hypothetical protein
LPTPASSLQVTLDYLPSNERRFEKLSFTDQVRFMAETDVLIGVHGGGLNNGQFMAEGSVVIDILPSNVVEYEWHNTLTTAGMHYLFMPVSDMGKQSKNCQFYDGMCSNGTAYEASSMACLGIRNCDVFVNLNHLDMLIRQASFLTRVMKRRAYPQAYYAESSSFDHVPSTTATIAQWNRGRMPDGRLDPLFE